MKEWREIAVVLNSMGEWNNMSLFEWLVHSQTHSHDTHLCTLAVVGSHTERARMTHSSPRSIHRDASGPPEPIFGHTYN